MYTYLFFLMCYLFWAHQLVCLISWSNCLSSLLIIGVLRVWSTLFNFNAADNLLIPTSVKKLCPRSNYIILPNFSTPLFTAMPADNISRPGSLIISQLIPCEFANLSTWWWNCLPITPLSLPCLYLQFGCLLILIKI